MKNVEIFLMGPQIIFFGGLSPKAPAAACGDAEIRLARGAFDPV